MPDSYQFLNDEESLVSDLRRCRETDQVAFNRIVVRLGEMRGSRAESARFVTEGWQDADIESVSPIWSLQTERINALRLKFWDVSGWRLIFFADHRRKKAALVAVMPRGDNYEKNPDLWERLKVAYERLGFERY